ncbi:hypothetical protein GCM10027425_12000 [Alteromonas gracilis]
MVSDPAAPARLLRRALTVVAGAVLILLTWTSSANADDSAAQDDRAGLLGAVSDVLESTTHEVGALVGTPAQPSPDPAPEDDAPSAVDSAPAEREVGGHRSPHSDQQRASRPDRIESAAPPRSEASKRSSVLERVTDPVARIADPVLEATRPVTDPARDQVERVVAPVREVVTPATRELRPVLEPVGDLLEPIDRTLSPVTDLLEPVTVVLRPVGDLVDDVALPTPLIPSEPSTVVPDDGTGPVRPAPHLEAPALQTPAPETTRSPMSTVRDSDVRVISTTAPVAAQFTTLPGPASSDAVADSPEGQQPVSSPAVPAPAATVSGSSPTGAGSAGPGAAALSDVWTPAAPFALDRPTGRSTTLLTVAAERPGFAPD